MEIKNNKEESLEKNKKLEALKKFFIRDLKIKEKLLKLAPTSLDDWNEESRIEYTDKLVKSLKELEIEFLQIAQELDFEPEVVEAIKTYFVRSREKFLIGHYNQGISQEIYQKQFSDMNLKLIEEIKDKCVGYKINNSHNLAELIGKAKSINELLHIMHSYIVNNDELLQSMPILAIKKNNNNEPIVLYGEKNEIAQKIFEDFSVELDCGITDIVAIQDKILMMIRDRGHALTIDIDTTKKDDILVRYFVPKLCNIDMIKKLPGIEEKKISQNGAIGNFQTSQTELSNKLFDFINKVPTDEDMFHNIWSNQGNELKKEKEPIYLFKAKDAKEMVMQTGQKGRKLGKIKKLQQKVKVSLQNIKDKHFKKIEGDADDRAGRD